MFLTSGDKTWKAEKSIEIPNKMEVSGDEKPPAIEGKYKTSSYAAILGEGIPLRKLHEVYVFGFTSEDV